MTFARGARAFHVQGDLADVSIEAESLQERGRHEQMAVRSGMHTVASADIVVSTKLRLGRGHRPDHFIVHIGEGGVEFCSEFFVNVTQVREVVVVLVRRGAARLVEAEVFRVHRAGRSGDDAGHAQFLRLRQDGAHVGLVVLSDRVCVGNIVSVVHAVAECRDGGVKHAEVVFLALLETGGRLTAPAELEALDVLPSGAREQIRLDEARVELLLRDGITDDGDACVRRKLRCGPLRVKQAGSDECEEDDGCDAGHECGDSTIRMCGASKSLHHGG